MKIQPINAIECALLHNRVAKMQLTQATEAVALAMSKISALGSVDVLNADADNYQFAVGPYRVSVLQDHKPLAASGFGGCLPQPITKIVLPDAEARVSAHRANTFISVVRSPAVAAADEIADNEDYAFGDFRDGKDAYKAMTLSYWIADAFHRNNTAAAIHWLPSDHLVSPQFFELAAQGVSLTPLFVRPYLFSSAGVIGKGQPVGMVANGAQYLMDRAVIFDEAPVSYEWAIQCCVRFIDKIVTEQTVPADGSGFSLGKDELVEVVYRDPEPAYPDGAYALVARNVPDFGISGGLRSVLLGNGGDLGEEATSSAQLDENDPVDYAILQALKDRAAEMRQETKLPLVKDRRKGPRETHPVASFGRRTVFGKR